MRYVKQTLRLANQLAKRHPVKRRQLPQRSQRPLQHRLIKRNARREISISSPKNANTLLTRDGIGSIDFLALDLTASERLNASTQIDKTAVAVPLFLPAPIHRLSEDLPRVRLDLV